MPDPHYDLLDLLDRVLEAKDHAVVYFGNHQITVQAINDRVRDVVELETADGMTMRILTETIIAVREVQAH